jgi:hypothetical protein
VRARALLTYLVGLVTVAACDSGGDEVTPPSTFAAEDAFARRVTGRVLRGSEPVEGALVQVDPSPGFLTDAQLDTHPLARSTATDAAGRFRVQFAPLRYDLYSRHDRDVLVVRDVTARGFDLQLGDDLPVRGYEARIVPSTSRPPAPGNALAFFVSGGEARTIRPATTASDGSLEIVFRRFETTIKLHVLEYVADLGIASAVAQGSSDVLVRAGAVASTIVPLTPVDESAEMTFETAAPAGYVVAPIDVVVDFGLRSSASVVARVMPGTPVKLKLLPGRYFARARATGDGASSDSGLVGFDPKGGRATLLLPPPLSVEAPIDDALPPPTALPTLDVGGALAARISEGMVEHVLQPADPSQRDGATVRIATTSRVATFPDVTRLGLVRPTGRYLWTMEHFPALASTDKLSGEDGRAFTRSSRSVSRVLLLR